MPYNLISSEIFFKALSNVEKRIFLNSIIQRNDLEDNRDEYYLLYKKNGYNKDLINLIMKRLI